MLQQRKQFLYFFTALPTSLQEEIKLGTHKRLDRFLDESGTFYDFINYGLTWDKQPQGRKYWEALAECQTLQEVEACIVWKNKTFGEIIGEMKEKRKEILLHYLNKPAGSTFFARSGNLRDLINHITWDATDVPRAYWVSLCDNLSNDYTRSQEEFWTTCENIEGEEIPRYKLDQLSERAYGCKKFAKNATYEVACVYPSEDREARVLAEDVIYVWTSRDNKRPYFKKDFEKWGFLYFNSEYYRNESAMQSHKIFRIEGEGFQKIDTAKHCYAVGKYRNISDLESAFVYVNALIEGVKIYEKRTNSDVFLCAYSEKYYSRNYETCNALIYVDKDKSQHTAYFSNQAMPSYSGRKTYRDQLIDPLKVEVNLSGQSMRFLSETSAKNFGIVLHHCTHCDTIVSQYHNTEVCKRQNFKNVRYDYHSHKPKRINTSAEYRIGVEIEKESFDGAIHPAPKIFQKFGWVKERDGSLDGQVGYELVSPCYPLFNDKLINEAEAIEQAFPKLINGEISAQCGGHIHFSKRGSNGANLLQAHCGYLPLLYAIYKGRTTKSYSHAKEKEEMKNSSDKYQAVRILSDRIEFRIFPAVKNVQSLRWRIKLLRYMAKNPTDNPLKVVNDLCDKRTALHKLFLEIFAEQTIYKRALDTLLMAQKYDRNFYNIDFSKQAKGIQAKAKKSAKK